MVLPTPLRKHIMELVSPLMTILLPNPNMLVLSARHAGNITLLQQNPPVLNWGYHRLTHIIMALNVVITQCSLSHCCLGNRIKILHKLCQPGYRMTAKL